MSTIDTHVKTGRRLQSGQRPIWRWLSTRSDTHEPVGPGANLMILTTLAACILFWGVPILWLFLVPSKTNPQIDSMVSISFGSLANYFHAAQTLFSYQYADFGLWIKNSLIYTGTSLSCAVLFSLMSGYALAIWDFPGRKIILWITVVALILPTTSLALPLFMEFNYLFNIIDSPLAVIIPMMFYPFGVYLSYVFFKDTLPADLLAAARIDGCSEMRVFVSIAVPLAKTLIGLLSFLGFAAIWNEYYIPYVMLQSPEHFPLPLGLQTLFMNAPVLFPMPGMENIPIRRPEVVIASLGMIIPVMVIFLFAQRLIIAGTLSGATKE
jgi:multiple sugar transport system permease protein